MKIRTMELLRAADIRLKKDVYALFEKAIKTMFEDGYHIEQADGSDIRFSNGDDVVRLSIKNGDAIPTCFKNEYVSPLVVSAQSFSNNTAPQPTADDAVARTFFIYKDAACSSVKAWEHMRGVAIERRKSGQTSEIRVMHPSGKKWNEFLRNHNCDPKSVKSVTVSKVVKADEKDGVLREYLTVEVAKKGRKALPIIKTGVPVTLCRSASERKRTKGAGHMVEIHGQYVPVSIVGDNDGERTVRIMIIETYAYIYGFIIFIPHPVYGYEYIAVDSDGMFIDSGYVPCDAKEAPYLMREGAVGGAVIHEWMKHKRLEFSLLEYEGTDIPPAKAEETFVPFGVFHAVFGEQYFLSEDAHRARRPAIDVMNIDADEWNAVQHVALRDGVMDVCGIQSPLTFFRPKTDEFDTATLCMANGMEIIDRRPSVYGGFMSCRVVVGDRMFCTTGVVAAEVFDILERYSMNGMDGSETVPSQVFMASNGRFERGYVMPFSPTEDSISMCVDCIRNSERFSPVVIRDAGVHGDLTIYAARRTARRMRSEDPLMKKLLNEQESIAMYLYDNVSDKVIKTLYTGEECLGEWFRVLSRTDSRLYRS